MAKLRTVLIVVALLCTVAVLSYQFVDSWNTSWFIDTKKVMNPVANSFQVDSHPDFTILENHTKKNMNPEANSFQVSPSHPDLENSTDIAHLVASVKKFMFFVGYARSGHSIIGSLIDAHPHVVTSNEFFLFSHFPELDKAPDRTWKRNLFSLLYNKSIKDAKRARANSKKGYTLAVDNLWQGRFDKYVEVIGDKSGGETTITYMKDKEAFENNFKKLKQELSMPIRIIHAVRNPFDIISTKYIYAAMRSKSNRKLPPSALKNKTSDGALRTIISKSFKQFSAVCVMIDELFGRENVLEVHNCDLVDNPRGTISRIFQFLEVETSEHFLDVCATKVFKSVSRSRDSLEWSPELREMVDDQMRMYDMFNRYNFTSD